MHLQVDSYLQRQGVEMRRVRHSNADAIRLDRDRTVWQSADALVQDAAERRVSRVQAARGHTARGAGEAMAEALHEEDEEEGTGRV